MYMVVTCNRDSYLRRYYSFVLLSYSLIHDWCDHERNDLEFIASVEILVSSVLIALYIS